MLQGLVHAKILKGVRRPRGGYELARERRRITAGEIVRTAMSLSTADPEDLGSNSVLLERGELIRPYAGQAKPSSPTSTSITVEQMCETAERRMCSTTRRSATISLSNRATIVDEKARLESKKPHRGIYAGRKCALKDANRRAISKLRWSYYLFLRRRAT